MKIIMEIGIYILIFMACVPAFANEEYTVKPDYYDSDDRAIYSEDGDRVGTVEKDYYNDDTDLYTIREKEYRVRDDYYSNKNDRGR